MCNSAPGAPTPGPKPNKGTHRMGPQERPGCGHGAAVPFLPFPRGLGREFEEAGVARMRSALSLFVVVGTGPLSPDIFPWTLQEPFLFHRSSTFLGEAPSRGTSPPNIPRSSEYFQTSHPSRFALIRILRPLSRCFVPISLTRTLRLSAEECHE